MESTNEVKTKVRAWNALSVSLMDNGGTYAAFYLTEYAPCALPAI
jgi:hypothetical protein